MKTKKLAPFSMIEVAVTGRGNFEAEQPRYEQILVQCGVPEKDWVFFENEKKPYAGFYTRSFKRLQNFEKKFKKAAPKGFRFRSRILERNDWFDKWQLDYKIMPIGERFVLVPLWQKKEFIKKHCHPERSEGSRLIDPSLSSELRMTPRKIKRGREVIYLDPKGASGSGQHPTTQIMISLIEELKGKYSDCLDLGTGTGILGIALAKLGGTRIDALDNDAVAVESAKFNFELNGMTDWDVRSEDVLKMKKIKKYSLVCANLISSVLDKVRRFLFASVKPGGYLLVSGIHVQNFPEFKKTFKHAGFRCLKIMKRRGWTSMMFKRSGVLK